MTNVIVTGNAGMLGSNFANWILEHQPNYNVIGIDNLEGGYLDNVDDRVIFYKRDCGHNLDDIFEEYKPAYVFHFACYAAEGQSPFIRRFNYTNNLVTTANIVNMCIKHKCKLIYASSMSVYGMGNPPFKETDICQPIDPYGIAKYACELDIQCAHQQHNLDYVIIRPHNIVGTQQNIWDKYRNVIGIWMRQIINKQPITIYGDGEQTRAFSWVMDYCPIFWNVAVNQYNSRIFNCGGDQHFTLNEVADKLLALTNSTYGKVHLQSRHEVKHAYCDHTLVKTLVGYEDKTTLDYMLQEMWNWAKVQPHRRVKNWEEFEIEDGLYEFWKK